MASFLIIGMGRFGSSLAQELYESGQEVLVLDNNEEISSHMLHHSTKVIIGDAKDEDVLESLGVKNFDCTVVATTTSLESNLLVSMMLKEKGSKKLVVKARDALHAKILQCIGVDMVIRPEYEMGKHLARTLASRNVIDVIDISPEYGLIEFTTPKQWIGKSIRESKPRTKYGIHIMAILKATSGKMQYSPDSTIVLEKEDILTGIGPRNAIKSVQTIK